MTKNWYVLYVKPKNEKKIADRLHDMNIEVYCPMITEVKQWSDRKKKVRSPLFKSYVFVRLMDNERQLVFDVPHIVRYLFWLGKPAIVRPKEMEALKHWVSNDDVQEYHVSALAPGDRVSIKKGVMKNQEAIIKEVGGNRARLILPVLGVVLNMKIRDLI